jgi:cytochrome c biogenesis protein CcdA
MMTLLVLAYLGGVVTIVSPCILPALPFAFARADRPFLRNGLPMLAGMAATFAAVATLAAVAGGWVVEAIRYIWLNTALERSAWAMARKSVAPAGVDTPIKFESSCRFSRRAAVHAKEAVVARTALRSGSHKSKEETS